MLSYSVMSNSLTPRGLQPTGLLCPWKFPGKNIGVGCPFLLQGIFSTQGLKNLVDSLRLGHWGSPSMISPPRNITLHILANIPSYIFLCRYTC